MSASGWRNPKLARPLFSAKARRNNGRITNTLINVFFDFSSHRDRYFRNRGEFPPVYAVFAKWIANRRSTVHSASRGMACLAVDDRPIFLFDCNTFNGLLDYVRSFGNSCMLHYTDSDREEVLSIQDPL